MHKAEAFTRLGNEDRHSARRADHSTACSEDRHCLLPTLHPSFVSTICNKSAVHALMQQRHRSPRQPRQSADEEAHDRLLSLHHDSFLSEQAYATPTQQG